MRRNSHRATDPETGNHPTLEDDERENIYPLIQHEQLEQPGRQQGIAFARHLDIALHNFQKKGGLGTGLCRCRRPTDLASLNEQLLAPCLANREPDDQWQEHDGRRSQRSERASLSPLAEEGFPLREILYPLVVDGNGRVKVKTNWYSAPLWPGLRVTAGVGPSHVEIDTTANAWRGTSAAMDAVIRF